MQSSVGFCTSEYRKAQYVVVELSVACAKLKTKTSNKESLTAFDVFICFSGLLPKGVMLDGTPRFTCRGKFLYHFLRIGAFSEYTVLPERAVVKVCSNYYRN